MTVLLDDLAAVLNLEEPKCCRRAFQEVAKARQFGKILIRPVEEGTALVLDVIKSVRL